MDTNYIILAYLRGIKYGVNMSVSLPWKIYDIHKASPNIKSEMRCKMVVV